MKLCIVSPVLRSVEAPAVAALADTLIELTKRGHEVVYKNTWLSSVLPHARTKMTEEALRSGAEKTLFLDDDIVFTVADLDCLLALDMGDDIVSGAYPQKNTTGACIGLTLEEPKRGALHPMAFIGLGFALMTRNCLERMMAAYDSPFEFRYENGSLRGEDVLFCERWRAIGGRIWLHEGVQLGHVGPHIFRVHP